MKDKINKKAVILFTRAPIKGQVKTRMQSLLKAEECAILQKCMIHDTIKTCSSEDWDLFICYTPKEEYLLIKELCDNAVDYLLQEGDNLGDKMLDAITTILNKDYQSCILVGSDIPDMKTSDIEDAFSILEVKDVVFGPTIDKGYYLVGMRQPRSAVFEKQIYGVGNVLKQTIDRIQHAGLTSGLITKYHDMDVPEDLYRFHDNNIGILMEGATNTRAYVRYLMEVYKK